jgi:molybdopterin-guanine dinucleotide biosynthesis protein A
VALSDSYSAIILAGGRSSRMGRPKPALRLGEATIIERIAAEVRRACDEVVIVAATRTLDQPWLPRAAKVIFDDRPFAGPVAALERGLAAASGGACFVCGCDQPFLRAPVVSALREMMAGHEAAIATIGGHPQVLCAAYRRTAARRAIARMVAEGEARLTRIVALLEVRWVAEKELLPYDPELSSFWNLNTPADYQRAMARMSGGELK